jgi:antitoxin component YwqK of YwqJK toxin-antitoxin module
MTDETNYNAEGKLDRKSKYKYDEQGNETEEELYSADGKLQRTILYRNEYDSNGNLIKKTQTDYGRDVVIVRREIQYF